MCLTGSQGIIKTEEVAITSIAHTTRDRIGQVELAIIVQGQCRSLLLLCHGDTEGDALVIS